MLKIKFNKNAFSYTYWMEMFIFYAISKNPTIMVEKNSKTH